MQALIVDDSRFLRERLKSILAPRGWMCAEAADGAEALRIVDAVAGFDLLLLDINMPVMGGIDCLRQLRTRPALAATKVMMVTTEADDSFISTALDLGADEFLMKPMTAETLEGKLTILHLDPPPLHAS